MDAAIFDRLQALASGITHEGYKPNTEERAFIKKHGKLHLKRLEQLKKLGSVAKELGYGNVLGKEFDKGDWTNISHANFKDAFKKAKKLLEEDKRPTHYPPDTKKTNTKKSSRLSRIMSHKGKIGAGAATIGIAAYMMNRKKDKGE